MLADRYWFRAGSEHYYREQVLRMPEGYVCYDPPAGGPAGRRRCRRAAGGCVTFGSFNNLAKIRPEVVASLGRDSAAAARGRGWCLKYRGLGEAARAAALPRTVRPSRGRAGAAGVAAAGRILCEYLAAYRQVDVALDPFPFSGRATTCEALWMGVPVMTCPGETFAGRHSLSPPLNVGLTEMIARDLDEYVEIAVALAHDLPRLAALPARLRGKWPPRRCATGPASPPTC